MMPMSASKHTDVPNAKIAREAGAARSDWSIANP
jgi:hypothetical protein